MNTARLPFTSAALQRVQEGRLRLYADKGAAGEDRVLLPSVTSILSVLSKPAVDAWREGKIKKGIEDELVASARQAPSAAPLREGQRPAVPALVLTRAAIKNAVLSGAKAPMTQMHKAAKFGNEAHAAIDELITGTNERQEKTSSCEKNAGGGSGGENSESKFSLSRRRKPLPLRGRPGGSKTGMQRGGYDWSVDAVLDGFKRFAADSGITIDDRGDVFLRCAEYGFAGAADAVCRLPDGGWVVCDWKTSNAIQDTHLLQASAYARALSEMLRVDAAAAAGEEASQLESKTPRVEAWVVRFSKTYPAHYEVVRVADQQRAFDTFTSAITIWRTLYCDDSSVSGSEHKLGLAHHFNKGVPASADDKVVG